MNTTADPPPMFSTSMEIVPGITLENYINSPVQVALEGRKILKTLKAGMEQKASVLPAENGCAFYIVLSYIKCILANRGDLLSPMDKKISYRQNGELVEEPIIFRSETLV